MTDKPKVSATPSPAPMPGNAPPAMTPSSMMLSDTQAALLFAEKRGAIDLLQVPGGNPVVAVPAGKNLQSVKAFIDEYAHRPERHFGTSSHLTLDSFIEHVNKFKSEGSVVFANGDVKAPAVEALYNYRTKEMAEFGDFTANFTCPLSDEWQQWHDGNADTMTQGDFAAFIENNIDDILDAPDLKAPENATLADLAKLLGYTFAGKIKMLELSRGIAINEASKAKQLVSLQSGEGQIEYQTEHNDGSGQRLKVPGLFLIAVPVFKDGPMYRVAVRLRYRLSEGRVTWSYDMYRADKVFDDAYGDITTKVKEQTGLPVFMGSPE